MLMKILDAIVSNNLSKVKNLYYKAFPKDELKPFNLILQKQKEGSVDVLAIENDSEFVGLAITAIYKNLVLLDYFAIEENSRNRKFGTMAFNLIKNRYGDKKFFLEIENPENMECENKLERLRRRNFYLKNGVVELPYLVDLLGVEMKILANTNDLSYDEYLSVYSNVFGREISDKIHLLSVVTQP